ncbi:hypothetical protein [Weissella cibaria]|uniref:hypothetical protein n=1 Tax=Weissella cibaria TaxID=137591 RepID=UPI0013DAEAE1|nr:hypothetical protein [Weissella cibaria]NFA02971.1 hypothetical protein [Weissella cibaria]
MKTASEMRALQKGTIEDLLEERMEASANAGFPYLRLDTARGSEDNELIEFVQSNKVRFYDAGYTITYSFSGGSGWLKISWGDPRNYIKVVEG